MINFKSTHNCSTCIYWKAPEPFEDFYKDKWVHELGFCQSPRLGILNPVRKTSHEISGKLDDVSISGDKPSLLTGPEFSCCHWTSREISPMGH